jgi:hypothetical protein
MNIFSLKKMKRLQTVSSSSLVGLCVGDFIFFPFDVFPVVSNVATMSIYSFYYEKNKTILFKRTRG